MPPKLRVAARRLANRYPTLRRAARVIRGRGPRVSLVVSVGERQWGHLDECLSSLRAQTHRNLEILLAPHGPLPVPAAQPRDLPAVSLLDPSESVSAARNLGASRATGTFLGFVDAGDTLPAHGIAALVRALGDDTVDLAVGRLGLIGAAGSGPADSALSAGPLSAGPTALAGSPEAAGDLHLGNRLARLDWWRRHGLSFRDELDPFSEATVLDGYLAATRFAVVDQVTYDWHARESGLAFSFRRRWADDLGGWLRGLSVMRERLASQAPAALQPWVAHQLGHTAVPFLDDVERYSDAQWQQVRRAVGALLEVAEVETLEQVRVEAKARAWLAAHADPGVLADFAVDRLHDDGHFATEAREGEVYAVFPGLPELPAEAARLARSETPVRLSLRRVRWSEDDALEIDVFAFIRHIDLVQNPPTITARLVGNEIEHPVELRPRPDSAASRWAADREQSYDAGSVTLVIDAARLVESAPDEWSLQIDVQAGGVSRTGVIRHRDRRGSAGELVPGRIGDHVVWPVFDRADGFSLRCVAADDTQSAPAVPVPALDGAELHSDVLSVLGTPPTQETGWEVALDDGTHSITGVVEPAAGERRCRASFELSLDPWGLGSRPAPSGRYRLSWSRAGSRAGKHVEPALAGELAGLSPLELAGTMHLVQISTSGDGAPVVTLAPPLADDERSPYAQRSLQRNYASDDCDIEPRTAYFQSYTGQSATDSPLAIHQELRRRRPDIICYWGVADLSSVVPEGAIPVLLRSREWYSVLARARWLVSNIEMDRWFRTRPGQSLLFTSHGYPGKSIGRGLWAAKNFTPRQVEALLDRTSRNWSTLLNPTPEMDVHFREQYSYEGTILNHGYPRDDVLVGAAGEADRTRTRELLGIGPGQTAVLYAPTWRDDLATNYRSAERADHLDLAAAARAMGPDHVWLLRGHRFHAATGDVDTRGSRIIDVTGYPEVNDLILAADAAVLDYSSLRFDFALTGRPMLFLVPDLDDYAGDTRGFLFDFRDSAPGPLLATTEEVVARLRDLDRVREEYADEYAAFNATYNRWMDGHAAERVVEEFFA